MKCSASGCGNKLFCGGMCLRHYRYDRYGECVVDGCRSPACSSDGVCDNDRRFPGRQKQINKTKEIMSSDYKVCNKCKKSKSRDSFYLDRGRTAWWRKECHSAYKIDKELRFIAFKQQESTVEQTASHKCVKCLGPLGSTWHADHIVPRSLGGEDSVDNIQIMCVGCNITKGNRESIDYRILK